ncbi:MAG TPA: hypothetical protein VFK45_05625 [Gammaproteobacteria bacterium]|nr:hypothetical protein [Gammaproteobacteria bacterium]
MKTKIIYRVLLVVVMSVAVADCSSVDVTSQVNPQFEGKPFKTLLVEAHMHNLVARKVFEHWFCYQMVDLTTATCIESRHLFFPGKRHTPEEIAQTIQKMHVDAVLRIGRPGSTEFTTHQSRDIYGNVIKGQTVSRTSNIFKLSTDAISGYEIVLLSPVSKDVIWYGSTVAEGEDDEEYDFGDYAEDSADAAINQMIQDGILHTTSN